jgi:hypothetical protein
MALESPQTYAEWFWKNSIDADFFCQEDYEQAIAPVLGNLVDNLPNIDQLSPYLSSFLNAFAKPKHRGFFDAIGRGMAEIGTVLIHKAAGNDIKDFEYKLNENFQNLRMTPEIANALMLRKKITPELWIARQQSGAYAEEEARLVYETLKPYPTIPDIITYARYHGDPDSPKELAWKLYDISPDDWPLWEWLSLQKLNTEQVLSLYKRKFFNDTQAETELARLGWSKADSLAIEDLQWSLPNAMLLVQGGLLQGTDETTILENISKADIHPIYAKTYLDAILTKPATTDVIAYQLRRDPLLSNLPNELRKIGIHPNYFDVYRELAYQIPPVADIITMAVREAFTPDIASRFGQYENLPADFVTWVGKKGLSKEWAERYWAAHWTLPSPQQGFNMLHRGIINYEELQLLLRALDVMPFWRDRLIKMAYEPFNRIDIRRMYQLGVLSEAEVLQAYKELGYDDVKASKITEFVVRSIRQTLSRFTSNDIIRAFTKRFIDAGQAYNLLQGIGIKDTEINNIIKTASYKREWLDKQLRIRAIENLYKKGKYTESQTRNELSALNLPADYVVTLIEQWVLKTKAEALSTWTSVQTLSFLKKGLISTARATQEFMALGYDAEHIAVYLASAKPVP